ncbi:MAG: hypothetical protein JWL77_3589 [Chthonomonadaceae bacterium]|nr:hypothetical protein [Chthonomonadaceae bacterium]
MDYLQTTGDRLHDLELDRILARLSVLEGGAASNVNTNTTPVSFSPLVVSPNGVRSITPSGGTPMQDDIALAVVGPVSLAQSAHTLTLTVSVSPATTVTEVGAANVVGTAARFAREDHVHRGVHKITASADAVGDIAFVGTGVSQSGNTFTFSSGGSAVPTNVLIISPGAAAFTWAVPAALTEFKGSTSHRSQHDLTNATQARIVLVVPTGLSTPLSVPTLFAQYSTNGGGTWISLDGGSGPSLLWSAGTGVSSWVSLAAGAKADVLLRVAASGGDGTTAITFASLYVQAK